ncbi:hypothetical protein [Halorussus sp. AFM4]|uniref:hypothetical protein n=1 Tax=Halorussus sp. AFM4 TaxID=3421651 RepID=UPI003EB81174
MTEATEWTTDRLRSRLEGTGAQAALVAAARPPPRPPDVVTVAPGVVAVSGPAERRAPLYVTAGPTSERSVQRYRVPDAGVAADRVAELLVADDRRAVWLRGRDQLRSWWSEAVTDLLERRLAAAVRRADARLVVWTHEVPTRDTDESASGDGAAVGDRYDVVLAP